MAEWSWLIELLVVLHILAFFWGIHTAREDDEFEQRYEASNNNKTVTTLDEARAVLDLPALTSNEKRETVDVYMIDDETVFYADDRPYCRCRQVGKAVICEYPPYGTVERR